MADPALGVVGSVLKTAVSLAAEEIALAWGVREELQKLADKREMIQALLSDAQTQQFTSKAVQLWLQRLASVDLDAQIVLDEFGYQVLRQKIECRKRDKVRSLFSSANPLVHRPEIAHKIKDVMSSLEEVFAQSNQIGLREMINSLPPQLEEERKTSPLVDDSDIVGRDDDKSELINMLVGLGYDRELPVITILGMGGQGKTTLAQLVYKSDKVQSYFDKRVWVCVSDDFNVERLLAEMLKSLEQPIDQLTTVEVKGKLKEQLGGKRYLLVLDDVWNEKGEKWDRMMACLKEIGGSKESKVLATTRSEVVAKTMRTSKYHPLRVLSEEQSWELFEKWAFAEGGPKKSPELVDIGKRILKRCGGVPLAIRVIGGLLYIQNCESEWSIVERSEFWREAEMVSSVIKLSYDRLPSLDLKQCFAYCAIFQKDTWMEKDVLIQLWMAQGLLNRPKGSCLQMEDIGNKYFYILLRSSLLEDVKMDSYNNIKYCKMHDLVHDVALLVSDNYCFHANDWKDLKDEIKAVHLSIIASEKGASNSWKDIKVPSKLRTLHWEVSYYKFRGLFANFKCLTVLILKDGNMKELPSSIGKMKHLRFLDISGCYKIRRLPKWVTELYFLQTLRVFTLEKLPKRFWKLINLRDFYVVLSSSRSPLIPRLSEMRNLQTLSYFKVDKCSRCHIEELEHLDNLKGELRIYCLQNVSTHESALKSNLSKKSEIQSLNLHWDLNWNWNWMRREDDRDDSDVMESLKPHSNLKSLAIDGYRSSKYPSWINLLGKLVKLNLTGLIKCERLPSLGHLPFLEHLEISGLHKVRCIGEEFYGWSNNVDLDGVYKNNCSSNASASQITTLFPSLKLFKLEWMDNLVEWSDAIVPAAAHTHSLSVQVFPVLEQMELYWLPELCSFPNLGCLPKLRLLTVRYSDRLTNIPSDWKRLQKSESEDERAASDSCVVSSWEDEGPSSSSSHHHHPPPPPPHVHYLPSLRDVILWNCGEFTGSFCSLKILAPIESLAIYGSPNLWPEDLHHLINLRSLRLGGYRMAENHVEVECFPFFPYSISNVNVDDVVRGALSPSPEDVQYFPSLTALTLDGTGFPHVTSLSDQIQYLTSLIDFEIHEFDGLEALPEWLGNLKSLQDLRVHTCKNLKQLPSLEAFQRLTNLQTIEIRNCSKLKEACTEGSGSEWPKIAHISNLKFIHW